jgi:hypothetical protein
MSDGIYEGEEMTRIIFKGRDCVRCGIKVERNRINKLYSQFGGYYRSFKQC